MSGRNGSASSTSTPRISTASVIPRKKPASSPTVVPTTVAITAAATPISSETRAP